MLKKLLITISAFACINAHAQLTKTDDVKNSLNTDNVDTVAWVNGGVFNLGVNEGFLHNWAAGGEVASLTVNGQFNGYLNRIYHKQIWTNNLDMTYGLFYAYSNSFVPKKLDDRIDFTSKYGVKMGKSQSFYFAGLFNFKSQFTKGYDYSVPHWDSFSTSKFMSPGYFTAAIGAEYRRGSELSLFLSPVALRYTVVSKEYTSRTPEGAYGVDYNKTSRTELGAYFTGRYQTKVSKKLMFKTRLDFYSNYLAKDQKDSLGHVVKKDSPGNIDILWDNYFSYKMSKHISLSLAATFIYDNDIPYYNTYTDATTGLQVQKNEPGQNIGWWQLKQVMTIGIEYRL